MTARLADPDHFAPFANQPPVTWRGMSGGIGHTPIHNIAFLGFDGVCYSFLITDLDLGRMVRDIVERFPNRDLLGEDYWRTRLQSDRSADNRADSDLPRGLAKKSASACSGEAP